MDATIVICTWNRASLLAQTLERMVSLAVPAAVKWEVLVVANNCTDESGKVLSGFAGKLPLRWTNEPRQGQSHARNRGTSEARGKWILWTDDDVLVNTQWLGEMLAAADRHPNAAFLGGPIVPWFESTPPAWIVANWQVVQSAFALRELGDAEFECDARRLPYGANFAVRTEIQRQFAYDGRLGRVADGQVRGEESQMLQRLLEAGHRGYWIPGARVQHFIPTDRLTLDYVRRFYYGIGQTEELRRQGRETQPSALAARLGHWTSAVTAESALRLCRLAGPLGRSHSIRWLVRASRMWGRLAACHTAHTHESHCDNSAGPAFGPQDWRCSAGSSE
jgi:glycosyltransferase involved in cell wall biosynthesis